MPDAGELEDNSVVAVVVMVEEDIDEWSSTPTIDARRAITGEMTMIGLVVFSSD